MNKQLKTACGVLALALAGQVSAATTWTLNTSTTGVTGTGDISAVKSVATGWADTGAVSGTTRLIEQQTAPNNFYKYTGGLGIDNLDGCSANSTTCSSSTATAYDQGDVGTNQPEHAIDNQGRYEMVLLSFTSAVQLSQMKMGWAGGADSDVTVMAYTGSGAPGGGATASLKDLTWSTTGATKLAGWSVIGNYADVGTSTKSINAGGTFSSYWLIGAYNPLGGGNLSSNANINDQNDYVKLASVSGCVQGTTGCNPPTTSQVPEPGSLALLGIGLLGLIRMRKAKQA